MKPMKLGTDLLAQSAYVAYGRSTGWKNYQGLDMPGWADLGDNIQNAWRVAVVEVVTLIEQHSRATDTAD